MGWWVSVVGGALVLLALWDVFHSLWHPIGHGLVSRSVMAAVWRASRRAGRRFRRVSGPLAMVAAIGSWGLLVLLGGALVYWPHVPGSFRYDSGLDAGQGTGLVEALYLSVVATATLGFGDIVPTAPWLRMVVPLQALVGFALLTAAVSWILQVYPALARRRALSLRLAVLERSGAAARLPELTPGTAAGLLVDISAALAQVRIDLAQYAESYYFEEASPQASLALTIDHAAGLSAVALRSPHADVRLAGDVLAGTLDELAELLDEQFLRTGRGRAEVLKAYAAQHSHG